MGKGRPHGSPLFELHGTMTQHPQPSPGIGAILLAAGESTRMVAPKALLDWKGVPLLRYQTEQLCETSVREVVVVLGYRAPELLPLTQGLAEASRVHTVVNPDYRQGKTTSIKAGLRDLRWPPRAC